jgi:hypothetical protein
MSSQPTEERQVRQLARLRQESEQLFLENEQLEKEINRLTHSLIVERSQVATGEATSTDAKIHALPGSLNPMFHRQSAVSSNGGDDRGPSRTAVSSADEGERPTST